MVFSTKSVTNVAGIVIPKAEDPSALSRVMKLLGDFENRYHVHSIITRETPVKRVSGQEESKQQTQYAKSLQKFSVFLGIETAKGVCCVKDLASSAPEIMDDRLEGFLFGAEDYAADIGAKRSKGNQEVVLAVCCAPISLILGICKGNYFERCSCLWFAGTLPV
jgi:citrate lyase beta subunit